QNASHTMTRMTVPKTRQTHQTHQPKRAQPQQPPQTPHCAPKRHRAADSNSDSDEGSADEDGDNDSDAATSEPLIPDDLDEEDSSDEEEPVNTIYKDFKVPDKANMMAKDVNKALQEYIEKHHGLLYKSREQDNWSKDPTLFTPAFGRLLSCDCFLYLKSILHLAKDEEKKENDGIWKCRAFLEEMSLNFEKAYRNHYAF
ncbi:hypothetical protein HDU98_006842, partial [Podochytrium sp. JEL0797]